MLRYRRVDLLLELTLLSVLAAGLVGALVVLLLDPLALLASAVAGVAVGLALGRALGESRAGSLVLGAMIALLGAGLYALYLLLDLTWGWAAGLASAALALLAAVLARAALTSPEERP